MMSSMRRLWMRIVVALLGLISLAEVVRMKVYGLPESTVLTIGWALLAALLLFILGAIRSDRAMRWSSALPPLLFVSCAALAGVAISRRWEWLLTISITLILSLPAVTVALLALRLNPRLPFALRRVPVPAGLLVILLVTAAATPPAWQSVIFTGTAEPDSVPRELLAAYMGCYRVDVEEWSPRRQPGHSVISPPRFIRLDTTRGAPFDGDQRSPGTIREQGVPIIRPGWLWGGAWWKPIDARRVVLRWETGFNGTRAVLLKTSDGFRGRARSWSDVVGWAPSPRTSLRAAPVSCDSVPADSARKPGALQRAMAPNNVKPAR